MELGTILLFCLATIGLTQLIVESYIFDPMRTLLKKISPFLGRLVDCHQCTGTWAGAIISLFIFAGSPYDISIVFVGATAGTFLGTWSALYMNYLEARTVISLGESEDE